MVGGIGAGPSSRSKFWESVFGADLAGALKGSELRARPFHAF